MLLLKKGEKVVSLCSSALTRAKAKLCEKKLLSLAIKCGKRVDKNAGIWKWKNREVYLGDGTILTMPDTNSNCMEYPKSKFRGAEVVFPKIRLFGLFSASSGSFVDGEIASYSGKGQAEPSLLLKMLDRIEKNSILVLDRFFTSLSLQIILQNYGIDYVIRGREAFVRKLLGKKTDKTVTIKKRLPDNKSIYLGMEFEKIITLRLISSSLKRKGFRDKKIYIITSLLKDRKSEVEKIYLERWHVELDIRNFKTTMESDHLKSKSPAMIRKELWVRLLGYNLVRNLTVQSSKLSNSSPRKRSFKKAMKMFFEISKIRDKKRVIQLLAILGQDTLRTVYRREPRAIKKRKNNYPLLTTTREEARKQDWGYNRRRPSNRASVVQGALYAAA